MKREAPPRIVDLTLTPTKRCWGAVSYYEPHQLPAIIRAAPEGSTIYARPSLEGMASRIAWRKDATGKKVYHLVPREAWEGGEPEPALQEIWDVAGVSAMTPGQAARRILAKELADKGRKWWDLAAEDKAWCARGAKGGIQRLWSTTSDHATTVDLTQAYARAMLGPMPVGKPVRFERPLSRLRPGMMAIVEAQIRAPNPRRAIFQDRAYEPFQHWVGPLPELLKAIELGQAEVESTTVQGMMFGRDHLLAELVERLHSKFAGGNTWRSVYTRLWTAPYARGGYLGRVCDSPVAWVASLPEEEKALWRRWPLWPRTMWQWQGPSVWAMGLPQVPAWVAGQVRSRMMDLISASQGVCHVYVDAITAETLPAKLAPDVRIVNEGPWRAAAPGRYFHGESTKHSGTLRVPYEELKAEAWTNVRSRPATTDLHEGWVTQGESRDGWPIAKYREGRICLMK